MRFGYYLINTYVPELEQVDAAGLGQKPILRSMERFARLVRPALGAAR